MEVQKQQDAQLHCDFYSLSARQTGKHREKVSEKGIYLIHKTD